MAVACTSASEIAMLESDDVVASLKQLARKEVQRQARILEQMENILHVKQLDEQLGDSMETKPVVAKDELAPPEKVLEAGQKKPLNHLQCTVLRQSRKMFLRMSKEGLNVALTNVTMANYPTQCPITHKMVTVNQSQPQPDGTMKMVETVMLMKYVAGKEVGLVMVAAPNITAGPNAAAQAALEATNKILAKKKLLAKLSPGGDDDEDGDDQGESPASPMDAAEDAFGAAFAQLKRVRLGLEASVMKHSVRSKLELMYDLAEEMEEKDLGGSAGNEFSRRRRKDKEAPPKTPARRRRRRPAPAVPSPALAAKFKEKGIPLESAPPIAVPAFAAKPKKEPIPAFKEAECKVLKDFQHVFAKELDLKLTPEVLTRFATDCPLSFKTFEEKGKDGKGNGRFLIMRYRAGKMDGIIIPSNAATNSSKAGSESNDPEAMAAAAASINEAEDNIKKQVEFEKKAAQADKSMQNASPPVAREGVDKLGPEGLEEEISLAESRGQGWSSKKAATNWLKRLEDNDPEFRAKMRTDPFALESDSK